MFDIWWKVTVAFLMCAGLAQLDAIKRAIYISATMKVVQIKDEEEEPKDENDQP